MPRARLKLHPLMMLPAVLLGILASCIARFYANSEHVQRFNRPVAAIRDRTFVALSSISDRLHLYSSVPAKTTRHPNGHLFLDPSSFRASQDEGCTGIRCWARRSVRHPIEDLMAEAEQKWKRKLSRQSKTLKLAVAEYRRRYGRNPPKGFDDWYRFATKNKVRLIDEFDVINRDVEPFLALDPAIVRSRLRQLQKADWTFAFEFSPGVINVTGTQRANNRVKQQHELMSAWVEWAPRTTMVFSTHDVASYIVTAQSDQAHRQAARQGKLINATEVDEYRHDTGLWGYASACPEDSAYHRYVHGLRSHPPGPSFVMDHVATMNLCKNPEWQWMHGTTAWSGPDPGPRWPLFSMAKTEMHGDIRATPLEQFFDYEEWDPPWEEKEMAKAAWRGTTTGVAFDRATHWRSSQRMRMYWIAQDENGTALVRFKHKSYKAGERDSIVERNVSVSTLVDKYLDFGFFGEAHQCSEEDGTCSAVRKLIKFDPFLYWNVANEKYKYLIDIDGNGWSGRFHRLLRSNSAIIKSTIFPEWYSDWIQPWYHYIPLKVDYTDFFDIMAFFAGDLEAKNAHDKLGKRIAVQGKEYAEKYWRIEDMQAYTFRLALEWARCTSDNRNSMDYKA